MDAIAHSLTGVLGPLWWFWFVAPCFVAFVYVLVAKKDDKRLAELDRWRKAFGPSVVVATNDPRGYREPAKAHEVRKPAPPRELNVLPGPLMRIFRKVGEGEPLAYYELIPRVAYLAVAEAGNADSSDYQAVVAKLDAKAASFTVRPTPIVEGVPQTGLGLEFPKDLDFSDAFVVESRNETTAARKAVRRWLSEPIRDALMDIPEAFLWVEGSVMALAYYGVAAEEDLNLLITAADTIFAEHGADGGASLFGEAEDDLDEGDETDGDEAAEAAPAADAKPDARSTEG